MKISIHHPHCNEDKLFDIDTERLDIDRWENDGGSSF